MPGFNPFSAVGAIIANNTLSNSRQDLQGLAATDPQGFAGSFGNLQFGQGGGSFQQSPQMQQLMQQLMQQTGGGLGGGLFNDPNFQNAFQQNDIGGFFGNAQQAQGGQIGNTAFGGLGQLLGNTQGLNNQFAQNISGGITDQTGGQQNFLFGQGQNFLNQAGNQQGLIQQNLDASRALAAPFEQRQQQALEGSLFGTGRNATTGGRQEFGDFLFGQNLVDQQRIQNAQQLGLQQQGQLANQGFQAFQQGGNLFGQNIGAFGQQLQGFNQTGNLGLGIEGQQFGQNVGAAQFNRQGGQQQFLNSLNLFGQGTAAQNQGFQQGIQGFGQLNQQQGLQNQLFLGSLNADANRIGAQGQFADPLAQIAQSQAAGQQGFFNNFNPFSDRRLKNNLKRIGQLGPFNWYEWTWNKLASVVGADKQPPFGVVADEVAKRIPDAVTLRDGYLTVDYRLLRRLA